MSTTGDTFHAMTLRQTTISRSLWYFRTEANMNFDYVTTMISRVTLPIGPTAQLRITVQVLPPSLRTWCTTAWMELTCGWKCNMTQTAPSVITLGRFFCLMDPE